MGEATNRAVFLSYSREDIVAARRIAEALRSAGIEVWFDEDELRGGDSWDARIKTQIKECALFVPVISAHTEARREGYFRREWKQAVQRLDDIADNVPFFVPVVVDDTPERGAMVPDAFRSVQWTRLRQGYGGQAPDDASVAAFCARLKILLSGEAVAPIPSSAATAPRPNATVVLPRPRRPAGALISGAVLLAVGLLLAIWQPWRNPEAASPKTKDIHALPADEATRLRARLIPLELKKDDFAAGSAQKSIAVLAFENRSSEKDSEYFSDGISEELANVLGKVIGLSVRARTSSFAFKGKHATAQEIGQRLNVTHFVEGSVQRVGSQARITASLIRADTAEKIWTDRFDRDLKDIFATQDEIAAAIAQKLQLTLGTTSRPTKTVNPDAHRLVLEARYHWNTRSSEGFARAEEAFTQAITIDPNFAEAHAGLGALRASLSVFRLWDGENDVQSLIAAARHQAELALALDAELPLGFTAEADAFGRELLLRWPAGDRRRRNLHAALRQYDEAFRLPVLATESWNCTYLFWNEHWDPVRDDGRFRRLLQAMDCATEYKTARETRERLLTANAKP